MNQGVMDSTYGARIRHEQVGRIELVDLKGPHSRPGKATIQRWKQLSLNLEQMTPAQQRRSFNWFLRYMMVEPLSFKLPPANKREACDVTWVPGHRLYENAYAQPGLWMPEQSDIMVIGKCLGEEEARQNMNWVGPGGGLIKKLFKQFGLQDIDRIYGTNVLKFLPPHDISQIPKAWLDECMFFLRQEIAIVKPKCILLLGADALKALFGTKATLKRYRGTVMTYEEGIKCIAANNPAHILRNPELMPGFRQIISDFVMLCHGKEPQLHLADHEVVKSEQRLSELVDELIRIDAKKFGIDCEWAGGRYNEPGAHLLTVQFSYKPGHAYVVMFRSDVSDQEFYPSVARAVYHLKRLFCRPDVRIFGHNFRADLIWLVDIGLDITDQFADNGFDTMLANHILEENDYHDLSSCCNKLLDKGRYDLQIQDLLAAGHTHASVPDELLWQYAADDADATYQLAGIYERLLWEEHREYARDNGLDPDQINLKGKGFRSDNWYPTLWNLYFEIVLKVNRQILEMEMNGLAADTDRMIRLIERFYKKQDQILAELRQKIYWPEFNPNSPDQVAGLLFSPANWTDGKGAARLGLDLTPIMTTGKRPELWSKLVERGLVKKHPETGWRGNTYKPSTNKDVLGALSDVSYEAKLIRDWRFVNQVCKNFLREPEFDKDKGEAVYTKGLVGMTGQDGRVRTIFSQLTETGRYRSREPNLQNIPKGREGDLARIFKNDQGKLDTIRSCFVAAPGHVYIEADFKSAELFTLAFLANDAQMKADLERVDESGNEVSLHTTTAIQIFRLDMSPAEFDKKREEDSPEGKRLSGLRTAGKSVNFGGNGVAA